MNQPVQYTATLRDLLTGPLQAMAAKGQAAFDTITRAQREFQAQAAQAAQQTNKVSSALNGVGGAIRGAIAGIGLASLTQNILGATANFEKFNAVLQNTLGSARAAQDAGRMLSDFASSTPFSLEELQGGFLKLVNRGIKPTRDQLRQLGDVAASQGKSFNDLVEAVLDAGTGEMERLKEFGVTAQQSGDKVRFTFKGVTTEVDKTDKAISQYLFSLGDVQGVSGSMAAQSATLAGIFSNLGDQIGQLFVQIGTLLRPVIIAVTDSIRWLVEQVGRFVYWIQQGSPGVYALAGAVAALAAGIAVMNVQATIAAVRMALLNLVMLANPAMLIVAAFAAVVAAIVYAHNKFEWFRGAVWGVWEALKEIFTMMKERIVNTFGGLGNLLTGIFTLDLDRIKDALSQLTNTGSPLAAVARIASAAQQGYAEGAASVRDQNAPKAPAALPGASYQDLVAAAGGMVPPDDAKAAALKSGGGMASEVSGAVSGGGGRSVTVNIDALVKSLTISTTTVNESAQRMQDMVAEALLAAVRDATAIAG